MIKVILMNNSFEEIQKVYREGNEEYLLFLDSGSYPLLSNIDDSSYDVFSGEQAKDIFEELIKLRNEIVDRDSRLHIDELVKLAFRAANESNTMLVFTPF